MAVAQVTSRPIRWLRWSFILGGLTFILLNYYARTLPDDPIERANLLVAADMPRTAESSFEQELAKRPLDLDLNYRYIVNHFDIGSTSDNPRDDKAIEAHYHKLEVVSESADLGSYGLGLIQGSLEHWQQALDFYSRVGNREQKYLNNSLGVALRHQRDFVGAENAFRREIDLAGNVDGAVSNLWDLYDVQGQTDKMTQLAHERNFPPYSFRFRQIAWKAGDLPKYLLALIAPFGRLSIPAWGAALSIAAMWFLYLWRIDIFEQEPIGLMFTTLFLGGCTVILVTVFTDISQTIFPMRENGGILHDFLYMIVHPGLIEEAAKLVPIILIASLTNQINEPLDYLIYGGLSALGFATAENALYFTFYGEGIVYVRFLYSAVVHVTTTGLICYCWADARFIRHRNRFRPVIQAYLAAAVLHALYDYFLGGPLTGFTLLSTVIACALAMAYGRMIANALYHSPFYRAPQALLGRLNNYELLLSTAVVLITVTFLYNDLQFTTQIADDRLFFTGWRNVIATLVVFGALGEVQVVPMRVWDFWRGNQASPPTTELPPG